MIWILERLTCLWCGLSGHDAVLRFEYDRLSLRCLACSYESPGWDLCAPILDAPSSTGNRLPAPVRTPARPRMIFEDDFSGASFARRADGVMRTS